MVTPHYTDAEFAALGKTREAEAARRPAVKRRGVLNKTEARFAMYLAAMQPDARIDFEAERFRLADGTNYTPDFRVAERCEGPGAALWAISFFEVNPASRLRTERDGIVRLKWAAQVNPMYRFFLARPDVDGWLIKRITGEES